MINELVYYFIFIYAFSGSIIFCGLVIAFSRERIYHLDTDATKSIVDLSELTVIIPFRNEQERIIELLRCFNDSVTLPKQLIFVDDQSNDATVEIIQANLNIQNYVILKSKQEGKKMAIEQAVLYCSTKDCITFDADITFGKHFFEHLANNQRRDMLILPVKMKGKSWRTFFEIDVDLANAWNCALAGFGKPILASGANLFFSKNAYLKFNNLSGHQHIASGDDVFLLANFKKNKCTIQLITDSNVSVLTPTPRTIQEYFSQRLRWLSKTNAVRDALSIFSAIVQLILNLVTYSLLIACLLYGSFSLFFLLLISKFGIDFAVTLPYFNRIGKLNNFLNLFLYQFWAPVLSIVLGIAMFFYKPTWKGRKVGNNKSSLI